MIIWLASWPRSGNTFLRIALNRLYGIETSTIYDHDGVAERLGANLIGAAPRQDLETLPTSPDPHFIKTHRQRDERILPADHAICLVRDGRDALVSWAHMQAEQGGDFQQHLQTAIETANPRGTGGWGANVLSWLQPPSPNHALLSYEDLIRQPAEAIHGALQHLQLPLRPTNAALPTFAGLNTHDPNFFRRGRPGAWREDMPAHLHDQFWANAQNRTAMELLGYER